MVNILELLPMLEGWSWVRISGSKTLNANDNPIELYKSPATELGWLVSARMSSTVADMSLNIQYDPEETGQTITFGLNPYELHSKGFYIEGYTPYVVNYDTENNEYAAAFNPSIPFSMKGILTVTASPGSNDGTIQYDVIYLQVTNENSFFESLRRALGVSDILAQLNQSLNYEYLSATYLSAIAKQEAVLKVEEIQPPVPVTQVTTPSRKKYEGFLP